MTPSFPENYISHIPALQVLMKLGYSYLPPVDALRVRGGRLGNVLLDELQEEQLRKINTINYNGKTYPFSDDNIHKAMRLLRDYPRDVGLVHQIEWLYNLLNLGESFKENLEALCTFLWREGKNRLVGKKAKLHYCPWNYCPFITLNC